MYELPGDEARGGCRDSWLLTRAVFAVLLPVVLAIIFIVGSVAVVVVLFARQPALALIPVAVLALALVLYARWERRHARPPGL